MITQAELKELLHYDPETGVFTWRATASFGRSKEGAVAGYLKPNGYRDIRLNRRRFLAHRLVWLWYHGSFPERNIDHIDGDPNNNRIENLRDVSQQENLRNCKRQKNNLSGVTGVCWKKQLKKWLAIICINRKQIHLGYFDNKDDAIHARKQAEKELSFHKNHGRVA